MEGVYHFFDSDFGALLLVLGRAYDPICPMTDAFDFLILAIYCKDGSVDLEVGLLPERFLYLQLVGIVGMDGSLRGLGGVVGQFHL